MTKKELLPVLYKKYKSKQKFNNFIDKLIKRILEKKPISDDAMLDGFIIGLIHSNSGYVWASALTDMQLPPMSDNQIQQVEQCIIWLLNNQEKLNEL